MGYLEILNWVLVLGLCVAVWLLIRESGSNEEFSRYAELHTRVKKLEEEARYIADQPQQSYYAQSMLHYDAFQQAYNAQPLFNEVPINDVVKAIVKHLDMQIEKVAEQTTKTPQEVKVVAKQPSVTITGTDGMRGTTSAHHEPLKPKRKYTKRKTK